MIIGIGTDIVDLRRFKVSDITLATFAKGMLGEDEAKDFLKSIDRRAYLAKQFAAKEAIIKATGIMAPVQDIQILRKPSGMPYLKSDHFDYIKIHLTISDEKEYAVAFAVAETDEEI